MSSNRLFTPLAVALTLPLAIFICRGRTIEMPRRHAAESELLAAKLKKSVTLQAQRRENGYALRLHRHAAAWGHERV